MRKNNPNRGEQTRNLLDRAAAFRAVALSFGYPDIGHKHKVLQTFGRIEQPPVRDPGLERAWVQAHSAWRRSEEEAVRAEYQRLFLNNGPVSLHETAHGDGRRIAGRPAELADISGFYSAFDLRLSDSAPDLPDHLCSELEFYSLLLMKQAYASRKGWTPALAITRRAARTFLETHLGRWTGAFADSLREHGAAPPYRELGTLLEAIVGLEVKACKVRPQLASGRLPHDSMQDEEFICPKAAMAGAAAA